MKIIFPNQSTNRKKWRIPIYSFDLTLNVVLKTIENPVLIALKYVWLTYIS